MVSQVIMVHTFYPSCFPSHVCETTLQSKFTWLRFVKKFCSKYTIIGEICTKSCKLWYAVGADLLLWMDFPTDLKQILSADYGTVMQRLEAFKLCSYIKSEPALNHRNQSYIATTKILSVRIVWASAICVHASTRNWFLTLSFRSWSRMCFWYWVSLLKVSMQMSHL